MRTPILLTAALLAASCSGGNLRPVPKPEAVRFQSQNQAGSVLVGVQSVAPFEAYVDALQPRFDLNSEEALRDAISLSQIQELRQLRSLALRIALNLPAAPASPGPEEPSGEEEAEEEGSENTEPGSSQEKGTAPQLAELLQNIEKERDYVSTDASLRYRTAAALLQEVALLSNYVRDAAVSSDTAPYVVRLLLTVFPSSRRSPYDVYTNISFFFAPREAQDSFVYNRKQEKDDAWGVDEFVSQKIDDCSRQPVTAIPLFVTDNFEASVLRSERGTASDVGGTLGGTVGSVGVGVEGGLEQQAGAATLGRGLNALFTLGPAAENTLAVRLGAANSDGGFEMQARTYNLTALVLVPTVRLGNLPTSSKAVEAYYRGGAEAEDILVPCSSIHYWAHSTFRDALNGVTLASQPIASLREELAGIGIDSPEAAQAVLAGDFKRFRESYPASTGRTAEYDWSAAMAARSRTGLTGGHFKVPRPIFQFFKNDDGEKVALYDDGEKSSIHLAGAAGIVSKGLSGRLTIEGGDKKLTLYNKDAKADADGTGATIEFPSVREAAKSVGLTPEKVKVEVLYAPPLRNWSPASQRSHSWKQEDTPVVGIETAPPSDRLARRGEG